MPSEEMGFAIIGCGVIAPWHASGITNTPGARLVACCDVNEQKAQKLAKEFGCAAYTDYREVLALKEVDIVNICTPSGLHGEIGIAAAKAGKHVLSEKPIDITLEKIDALIAACKENNVQLGCIFQSRTKPLFKAVKAAIEAGELGKLLAGDAYLKYYRSQEYYDSGDWRGTWALDGGGCLMNQGVHMVDMIQWLMGPVDTVFGFADHLAREIEVEDTVAAVLKFKNGAFGVLEGATSFVPGIDHRIEIHGEEGSILIHGEKVTLWHSEGKDKTGEKVFEPAGGTGAADPKAIGMEGHRLQIQDMMEAVLDHRPPLVPGEEARKSVEIILAVYKSSESGQPVNIPLIPQKVPSPMLSLGR